MKSITLILSIALLSVTFISCKKDKENPKVLVEVPVQHSTHKWGATVHINAAFSDDRNLKNYTVFFGNEAGDLNTDFNFNVTEAISGESYAFHNHFIIPDSVSMNHGFIHFNLEDEEGKKISEKWMIHFEK